MPYLFAGLVLINAVYLGLNLFKQQKPELLPKEAITQPVGDFPKTLLLVQAAPAASSNPTP